MAARRRRVVWSQGAHRELDEAVEHIAAEAPRAALCLLERVLKAAASLETLSERGRIVPEREDPRIRELLVEPFRLLYALNPDEIVVLGLIHQRQEFALWRGSRE